MVRQKISTEEEKQELIELIEWYRDKWHKSDWCHTDMINTLLSPNCTQEEFDIIERSVDDWIDY